MRMEITTVGRPVQMVTCYVLSRRFRKLISPFERHHSEGGVRHIVDEKGDKSGLCHLVTQKKVHC